MNPEKINFENQENSSQIVGNKKAEEVEKNKKEIPETDVASIKKEILDFHRMQSIYKSEGKKDKVDTYERKINELLQRLYPDQKLSEETISNYRKDIYNESLINESHDFRQLYKTVADNEIKIVGSNNDVYNTETLLKLIGDAIGGKDLRYLPRSLGLRSKVKELLNKKEIKDMNIERGPRGAEMPEEKKEAKVTEKDKEAQEGTVKQKMETLEEALAELKKEQEDAKENHSKRFAELNNVWKELSTKYGNDSSMPEGLREAIAKKRQEINNEYEYAQKAIKEKSLEVEEKSRIEEINKVKEQIERI